MAVCYHDPHSLKPRYMKPLRYQSVAEKAEHMREMKAKNIVKSANNPNENWLRDKLMGTGHKWSRQCTWGFRIFDFWCHELGIAVESDGPEHIPSYDSYRDEYNLRRSGIIVLHVRNKNENDLSEALEIIKKSETWKMRRDKMGLNSNSKKGKRKWVVNPPSSSELFDINSY